MAQKIATEKVIEVIKAYPALYDPAHPDFYKCARRDEIWNGIGKIFSQDARQIKMRWNGIRRSYSRYLHVLNQPSSNSNIKMWPYARHMQFYNFKPSIRREVNAEIENSRDDETTSENEDVLSSKCNRIQKRRIMENYVSYSEDESGIYTESSENLFNDDEMMTPCKTAKSDSDNASCYTVSTPSNSKISTSTTNDLKHEMQQNFLQVMDIASDPHVDSKIVGEYISCSEDESESLRYKRSNSNTTSIPSKTISTPTRSGLKIKIQQNMLYSHKQEIANHSDDVQFMYGNEDFPSRQSTRIQQRKIMGKYISYSEDESESVFDDEYRNRVNSTSDKAACNTSSTPSKTTISIPTRNGLKHKIQQNILSSDEQKMSENEESSRKSTRIEQRKIMGKYISYSEDESEYLINDDNMLVPYRRRDFKSYSGKAVCGMTPIPIINGQNLSTDPVCDEINPVVDKEERQTPVIENTSEHSLRTPCKCKTPADASAIYHASKKLNSLELIFLSFAKSLEKLPPEQQLPVKIKIADIMMKEELLAVQNRL